MKAFFERYLPINERRTALWLGLGGAAVWWAAEGFGSAAAAQMAATANVDQSPILVGLVQGAAVFGLVSLLAAALIGAARAPKALALYLILGASLDAVLRMVGGVAVPVGVLFGAVAGAWIADTVTLARIRDAGFSGDDSEEVDGLRRKPASRGWSFVGWKGRPLGLESLLAVTFVAVTVLPSAVYYLTGLAVSAFAGGGVGTLQLVAGILSYLVTLVAWYYSASLISRRTEVVSLWVPVAAMFVIPSLWSLSILFFRSGTNLNEILLQLLNLVFIFAIPAAVVLGTAHALRLRPATLSAPDQQDPGAEAPADTAGGS